MTAKEYLGQVRQAELRIEALRERRRRCAEWSGVGNGNNSGNNSGVGSGNSSGGGNGNGSGGGNGSSSSDRNGRGPGGVSGVGSELEALGRELDERIEACAALVREVEARIDALDNPLHRDVLKFRYLNGWSWRVISCRMGLSRDWLMSVHRKAVGEMENGE